MRRLNVRPWLLAGLLLAMIAGVAPGLLASQPRDWNVIVATNAFLGHGMSGDLKPIKVGSLVAAGDRVTTRAGGAVVLARGEDLISLAENTQVAIADPQPSSKTLIEQPYGQAQYHVAHKAVPHFEVDTPMLATVVKGTTFTVAATATGADVSVQDGRVTAIDRRSGSSSSVSTGQTGAVSNSSQAVSVGATSTPAASGPVGPGAAGPATTGPAAGSAGGAAAGPPGKDKPKGTDKAGPGSGGPAAGGPAGGSGDKGKPDKPDKGPKGGKHK